MRRAFWFLWRWDAEHPAIGRAGGYATSKSTARWYARAWVRSARPSHDEAASAPANVVDLAAAARKVQARRAETDVDAGPASSRARLG